MEARIKNQIEAGKITELDVRPILASGTDPFNFIMKTLKEMEGGTVLRLINSFEPRPLINILNSKGYESSVSLEEDLIVTYLLKPSDSTFKPNPENTSKEISMAEFERILGQFAGKTVEIDVRNQEMPDPMVSILTKLEGMKCGEVLHVHHKKVPQLLLPELAERHLNTLISKVEEGYVKLLIHR